MECRKRGAFRLHSFRSPSVCYYSDNSCHLCVPTPPVTLRTFSISWGLLLISWVFFDIFFYSLLSPRDTVLSSNVKQSLLEDVFGRDHEISHLRALPHTFPPSFFPITVKELYLVQIPIRMRFFVFFWKRICTREIWNMQQQTLPP